MHKRRCVLCLPFNLVIAIECAAGHHRFSMRLWLGLCLNGGPDPATPATARQRMKITVKTTGFLNSKKFCLCVVYLRRYLQLDVWLCVSNCSRGAYAAEQV